MSKRVNMSEKWVTYPHGPLEKLADNLWCVQGTLPHMPIGRAMTVIKKSTGSLVLHSPIALDDEGMQNLRFCIPSSSSAIGLWSTKLPVDFLITVIARPMGI